MTRPPPREQATPDGPTRIRIVEARAGAAKMRVVGKGANPPLTLPFTTPVRVQVKRIDTDACWEALYTRAARNDGSVFRATSD